MSALPSVLIVDDDPGVQDILSMYFVKEDFEVRGVRRGADALRVMREQAPSAVLLDIMMPGMDGYEVCRRLLADYSTPVLFLTCRDDDLDPIIGLELGADDYITKPFNPREVVARVKAVLRRTHDTGPELPPSLSIAGLEMDQATRETRMNRQLVKLTRKEYDILYLLASNPRIVFSREEVMSRVWGYGFDYADVRTVDTHVKRVRKKATEAGVTDWTIEAVWGTGYRFVPEEPGE